MIKKIAGVGGIVLGFLMGLISGSYWVGKQYDKHCEKIERDSDKFSDYYTTMLQWVRVHQKGKNLSCYFKDKGYRNISIYGMNDIAHAMIAELKESDVTVSFCVDRNADNLFLEMPSYRPDQELPEADVCVVALPDIYTDISEMLSKKINCPIVSIEDVVWDI